MFIPYTQTSSYFESKKENDCELIRVNNENKGNSIYLVKENLRVKNVVLPFLHKIYSTGIDIEACKNTSYHQEKIEKLIRKYSCLRCQIIAKPVENREAFPLFKDTLYTYMRDLEKQHITDQETYLGFDIQSSQPN